ncbi:MULTISPECIES: hypothetical protein [unclassified Janthinobacterium]|uniref:hypothetical protein n=1 Tax=unclassified Janthinobacterium TaxID=2610881 RepID=UPI0011145D48|nr:MULTISPECIES: hypothetical protein [unclassified Janthinobacterium]
MAAIGDAQESDQRYEVSRMQARLREQRQDMAALPGMPAGRSVARRCCLSVVIHTGPLPVFATKFPFQNAQRCSRNPSKPNFCTIFVQNLR